jgi:hypothetical protein
MTKNEALYCRLEELEREFRAGLEKELEKVSVGRYSDFLAHRTSPTAVGRYWVKASEARLSKIWAEVNRLRKKLGEPVPGPIGSLLNSYVERVAASMDRFDGGKVHIARKML